MIVAESLGRLDPIDGSPGSWVRVLDALIAATESNPGGGTGCRRPQVTQGTTHISVVDADGMLVSMTTSNGAGSGVVHPGTGIHLNNMMGEEDLNPAVSLAPTRHPDGSMMAPIILTGPDGSVTGLGTGGSERIRSALLLTVLRLVDLGESVPEAVAAPRFHPNEAGIQLEPGWDSDLPDLLRRQGPVNIWAAPNLFYGGCAP